MDRRACNITAESLADMLDIPGDITHIEFDRDCNIIKIFFTGDGTHQVPEGGMAYRCNPSSWRDK